MMKKTKKYISGGPLSRLVFIYILCAVCFLAFHLVYGIINVYGYATGKYAENNLTLNDFEIKDGEMVNTVTLINGSDDTQLIYTGKIRNLTVKCTFSENPGEFVCFYNKTGDYVFGTDKMEYARIYDGYYIFDFPVGTKQIRLDTGIFSSTTTVFEEITINRPSVYTVTNLSAGDLFSILVLPAFCFMVIETVRPMIIKKKK